VKTIAARLKDKGTVSRGWIGVEVQSASPEIVEGLGLNKPVYGVLVTEIQPASPAEKAGIVPGDVITSVAGQPASDDRDLIRRVSDMPAGKSVELGLNRQNEKKMINVTLGELPVARNESRATTAKQKSPAPDGDRPNIGLTLMPADNLGLGVRGVVVIDLDPAGVAADSGLSTGDVILDVGGSAVKTSVDFYKALTEVQGKGRRIALARVRSNEATRFIAIPLG
jgi:serine protease Do